MVEQEVASQVFAMTIVVIDINGTAILETCTITTKTLAPSTATFITCRFAHNRDGVQETSQILLIFTTNNQINWTDSELAVRATSSNYGSLLASADAYFIPASAHYFHEQGRHARGGLKIKEA